MAERGYCFGLGYTSWEWNERMSGWAVRDKKNEERERERKENKSIYTNLAIYVVYKLSQVDWISKIPTHHSSYDI